jgi:hypothetical protein
MTKKQNLFIMTTLRMADKLRSPGCLSLFLPAPLNIQKNNKISETLSQ